jgi:hypothetical protein
MGNLFGGNTSSPPPRRPTNVNYNDGRVELHQHYSPVQPERVRINQHYRPVQPERVAEIPPRITTTNSDVHKKIEEAKAKIERSKTNLVMRTLKHLRTRSQLATADSNEKQQFTLAIYTWETDVSKIYYLNIINQSSFCKVAKIYYIVSNVIGHQEQFECKFDLGMFFLD